MKKKIAKLIFDITVSLAGLVGAWSCMSQGFEYLFVAENPDMAAFKICSSIFISIATALLIFIFIPLDIDGIQKIRREKEAKKTVEEIGKIMQEQVAVIGSCKDVRQFLLIHKNDAKNYIKVSSEYDAYGRRFDDWILVGNPNLIPTRVIHAVKNRLNNQEEQER